MTEQHDQFTQNKQQTEREKAVAVEIVASDEVRHSATTAPARRAKPFVLLLLLVVLIGAYLLINRLTAPVPILTPATLSTSNKQPMPLRQSVVAPPQTQRSEPLPLAADETTPASKQVGAAETAPAAVSSTIGLVVADAVVATPATHYFVQVGPFLSQTELATATKQLQALSFIPQKKAGRGLVTMTRLLEGRYPEAAARKRLGQLRKTVGDAFILPTADKWALYVGSFSDPARAASAARQLAKNGLKVTLVTSELEMSGSLLMIELKNQAAAEQAAELLNRSGLKAGIVSK